MKITRYRGDTYDEVLQLIEGRTPVNLTRVASIQFTFDKNGSQVMIAGVKDLDDTTGRFMIPFTESQVDTIGLFDYDIQVVDANGKKITYVRDQIEFEDDLNKS